MTQLKNETAMPERTGMEESDYHTIAIEATRESFYKETGYRFENNIPKYADWMEKKIADYKYAATHSSEDNKIEAVEFYDWWKEYLSQEQKKCVCMPYGEESKKASKDFTNLLHLSTEEKYTLFLKSINEKK